MPFAPSTQPIVAQSAIRNAGISLCAVYHHALIAAAQGTLRFIPIDRCAGSVACPITDSFPGGDTWANKIGWGVATWPICGGTGFWRDGSAWPGVGSCDSNLLVTAL